MPSYKAREGVQLDQAALAELIQPFASKFWWFKDKEYVPHYWQALFHTLRNGDTLSRYRHLSAGRRGGKTLSAAWELLYYLMHPEQFHKDAHGTESSSPLVAWVLTKDYPAGLPALMVFRDVLRQARLTHGVEYKENKGNRWFEFENGSWLFFKTADEPDSLRGAGLDILWMDEASFIENEDVWTVVRPALSDKVGLVLGTTTPSNKGWYYNRFWSEESRENPDIGRVEYWSIDNPYFSVEEWDAAKREMHPALFLREFCADWNSMAGKALRGDWLHYYGPKADPENDIIELPRNKAGRIARMNYYVGVDPAISLSDKADKFAMACIGITEDNSQAFLIETFADRIPFPEQVDMIALWANKYRPAYIGIESVAYQAALAQQAMRLPGLPNIVAIIRGRGKKSEHILAMSPLFRTGRIRVRKDQRDFISEWIDYDDELKNPHDDLLDAVEIAIRSANVLLPNSAPVDPVEEVLRGMDDSSLEGVRRRELSTFRTRRRGYVDSVMGTDW